MTDLDDGRDTPLMNALRQGLAPRQDDSQKAVTAYQKTPGPDTARAALAAVHPLVERAVAAQGLSGDPLALSRGRRLALDALTRYDPNKAALSTYLHASLQGVRRQSRKAARPVAAAGRVGLERARAQAAAEELEHELGRPASAGEVADRIGVPLKRLSDVLTHRPAAAGAAFAGGDGPAVTGVGPAKVGPWAHLVYQDLSPNDQLVMEHTLGLYGQPVLGVGELAKRINRSPGAVSQARRRIQELLDLEGELSPFARV